MKIIDTPTPGNVVATPPKKRSLKSLATQQDIIDAKPLDQLKLGDGLYLCINKNGKKLTYKFRSYFNGKTSLVKVGQYPDLTILDAQKLVNTKYRANVDKARQTKSNKEWEGALKVFKPKVKSGSEKLPCFRNMMDSAEFIRILLAKVNQSEIHSAIWLQMLVPWRSAELLNAKWTDLDRDLRVWTINSKSTNTLLNQIQIEFISNVATNLIIALPSYQKLEYLFPSLCTNNTSAADRNKIIANEIDKIWSKYPIKPEYFKNFFITIANRDSHFKPEFIRAMVNHKSKENRGYYLDQPHKRTLTEWWAQTLLKLGEVKSTNQSPDTYVLNPNI